MLDKVKPAQNQAVQGKSSDILKVSIKVAEMCLVGSVFQKTFLIIFWSFSSVGAVSSFMVWPLGDPAPSDSYTRSCREGPVKTGRAGYVMCSLCIESI